LRNHQDDRWVTGRWYRYIGHARLIDLFIQLCLQNNGRLSPRQQESHFAEFYRLQLTNRTQFLYFFK